MLLIVGGIIVIAIIAAVAYRNYLQGLGNEINSTDVQNVTNNIKQLNTTVSQI
ncbi:MAG TPA: class III signal peptide-containing protein [Methanobacteriaceae archaeon]|nr:class III signal peptide-containing protein [Methanobacteriaceae archaeon]